MDQSGLEAVYKETESGGHSIYMLNTCNP